MTPERNLSEMTKETIATFKAYQKTGTLPWTYETAAKDLSYQVGSLTKLIMQLNNERFANGKTDKQLKVDISDELADILAEVLFIAHELNIDIQEAWSQMKDSDMEKIKTRSFDK